MVKYNDNNTTLHKEWFDRIDVDTKVKKKVFEGTGRRRNRSFETNRFIDPPRGGTDSVQGIKHGKQLLSFNSANQLHLMGRRVCVANQVGCVCVFAKAL